MLTPILDDSTLERGAAFDEFHERSTMPTRLYHLTDVELPPRVAHSRDVCHARWTRVSTARVHQSSRVRDVVIQ